MEQDADADPGASDAAGSSAEEKGISMEERKARRSSKSMWILTYGASGPYVDAQMLRELGKIQVDECHSTKDRVMAYTYIHLIKSVRQTCIETFMKKAQAVHGIIRNEIFGYSSIASNTREGEQISIEEHVGFQMLVRHYTAKDANFLPWTDGEPILKRGRILKADEIDPSRPTSIERKSKVQIIEYARNLEGRLQEAEHKLEEIHSRHAAAQAELSTLRFNTTVQAQTIKDLEQRKIPNLLAENAVLKRKIQEMENGRA